MPRRLYGRTENRVRVMRIETSQSIAEKIQEVVEIEGREILEIGCGYGRVTQFLIGQPSRFVAIDPDADRLVMARDLLPDVEFHCASGECLPFVNGGFDCVIFTQSLHHHSDGRAALREAARVLKNDGRIVVIEPVNDGELESLLNLLDDETQVLANAQSVVRESGLRCVHSEGFFSRWVFDHKMDLFQSLFAYYRRPYESSIATQMVDMLAGKLEEKPIAIRDSLLVQVLKKAA